MQYRHQNEAYQDMMFKASYYRWEAAKGFAAAGNCPLTGRPKGGKFGTHMNRIERGEGIAAHKSMASYWLNQAKQYRIST